MTLCCEDDDLHLTTTLRKRLSVHHLLHNLTASGTMGYELHIIVAFTILSLVVGAAWVGGYLDAYQSKAQEVVLDKMGENKASYGLKSMGKCHQYQR